MRFGSLVVLASMGREFSGFRAGALAERLEASRLLWLLWLGGFQALRDFDGSLSKASDFHGLR